MIDKQQWAKVVENSPGWVWHVEIVHPDGGREQHEIPFVDTKANGGLLIGSDPTCNLVLPSAAPRQLLIWAASNHKMIEVLEGSVRFRNQDRVWQAGSSVRFLGPIFVDSLTLRVVARPGTPGS
ncbi:MAG: hypothetical protein AB7U73_08155 [Pirellulales bacterium]